MVRQTRSNLFMFGLLVVFLFNGTDTSAASTIKVIGGANQKSQLKGESPKGGIAKFGKITIQILKGNKPVKGEKVYFDCKKPRNVSCQIGSNTTYVGKTNSKGIAKTPSFRVYYGSGKMSINVSAKGAKSVSIPFTVAKKAPPPKALAGSKMTIVSGNNQTKARERTGASKTTFAYFKPLVVKVTNKGKPVNRARITFKCKRPRGMACQFKEVVFTNKKGIASSTGRTYYADGKATITAAYGKSKVQFNLVTGGNRNSSSSAASTIKVIGGANQKSQLKGESPKGGIAKFGKITIQILKGNKPVKGEKVYFDCKKPRNVSCQIGSNTTYVGKTNSKGIAKTPSFRVYYGSGKMSINVSAKGAKSVSIPFTVAKKAPPPKALAGSKMTIVSGNNQTKARERTGASKTTFAYFKPLVVKVTNKGKPVNRARITFKCKRPRGMACQFKEVVFTNKKGIASSTGRTYYADGKATITAAYGKSKVQFNLVTGKQAQLASPASLGNLKCDKAVRKLKSKKVLGVARTLVRNNCSIMYRKKWLKGKGKTNRNICVPAWNRLRKTKMLKTTKVLITNKCPIIYSQGWRKLKKINLAKPPKIKMAKLPMTIAGVMNKPVCIRAAKGQYVVVEKNQKVVNANRRKCGSWETFIIRKDSIYNTAWKTYLSCQPNGRLEGNRKRVGSWEKIRVIPQKGRTFAFRCMAHGKKYLVAEGAGGKNMNANRPKVGSWERFRIEPKRR